MSNPTRMSARSRFSSAVDAVKRVRIHSATTWGVLVAVLALNAFVQPTLFTQYSITSNFATFAPLVLVAIAQTIVVIGGGIDLSIGAVVALSSVVAVVVMNGRDGRVGLGFLAAILTGTACGLTNGLIVARLRLQPLIATFATTSIFSGLALVVMPTPGGIVPPIVTQSYRTAVAGVPVSLLVVLAAVGLWLIVRRTRLMRHIYALGGDPVAAYASLVPVSFSRAASYVLSGLFGGLAAMALLANSGSGDPFAGSALALDSVAAVVLGGVTLRGGQGGAVGATAGAVTIAVVSNVLFFLGVPTIYRELANGLVIIAALALSVVNSGRRGQR